MIYYRIVAAAAFTLACAYTPSVENTDNRLYLESAETTRSERDVAVCAQSRTTSSVQNGSIENTAYGQGTVSDRLSFRTHRSGDRTVLTVMARSYVFPESGRGEANTNVVAIPVTDQAKYAASQVIKMCTREPG